MTVKLKKGIDKLIFGMKQVDVIAIYGKPNKQFIDDEENIIFVYNDLKFRLTFYAEEGLKLGYIICYNIDLQLFDNKIIEERIESLKSKLPDIKTWEIEDFDLAENHFNEENWLVLVSEFGLVSKIELGAIINDSDAFDWKF